MQRHLILTALWLLLGLQVLSGCKPKPAPTIPGADSGRTTAADPDPHWVIRQSPPAKVALVYVHGVTGDMIGTWTADNGKTFWDLANENEQLKGKADAFVFGFPSHVFQSGSFDIQQAANSLHERLEFSQVLNYPAVVFVAHSMGGLVVLRELLTHREVLEKVPVVMFYATPMEGSVVATYGKEFSPNSALAQMTEADGNALLQILDNEWKSIPDNKRPHVRCAYENKPVLVLKVVPWASATRFCEGATPAVEATHITIVKPDRPGADAIVYLANALNAYVLGKQLEAKLETPDFAKVGAENVFTLTDSFGRQPARLLNEGGSPLRFTFVDPSDPSLWLTPDDTPRDIAGHDRVEMHIGLGRGATKSEYQFTLRTPIQPDMRVTVRVPDLAALHGQQEDAARKVAEKINAELTDPQQLIELQQAATDDKKVPARVVQIAHDELARENPKLPDSTQWVLTADLLNSLNWPSLAGSALRNAEKASPAVAQTAHVQFLSAVVASQSGEKQIFASAKTPVLDPVTIETWTVKQPLAAASTIKIAEGVAYSMERIPPLRVYGLSLKGDVEQAKGNAAGASAAYKEAAAIRPSPSVSARLLKVDTTSSTQEPYRLNAEQELVNPATTRKPSKAAEQAAARRRAQVERVEQVQTPQPTP